MGKGTNTTTNETTTAPSAQAGAAYSSVLNQAQGVAATPYQSYSGELVAPFNAEQNAGVAGVNQYANAAQPAISSAMTQTAANSQPLTSAQIQQYMSPYTQDVVNSTQAQFNNQNQQQQQGVVGNAIAQGALGGNRSAVAQSEMANQQQLAQAPVIAGLENQGYQTGLSTAQQQQQVGLQGAAQTANLGVAGQTAGLTGAGTQLSAGAQQQATQQALDTANYGQFQNQQAYPFEEAQWLAGIDTGVGSQLGGTSTGETTAPAPSIAGQVAGAATAGTGILGATGAFGSAGWMLPALAALARGGIAQIEDEIKRAQGGKVEGVAGFAGGGAVRGYADGGWTSGVSAVPYSGARGYIPTNSITHGSGPPHASAPAAYNPPQNSLTSQAASIGSLAKTITDANNGKNPGVAGTAVTGDTGPSSYGGSTGPTPLVGVSSAPSGVASFNSGDGVYARGGTVHGFADGGSPTDDDSTVINPDDPIRLDPDATDRWRKGNPIPALGTAPPPKTDDSVPDDLPPAQGIAPATAMALTDDGNRAHRSKDLPSEVSLGYSDSNGIAPASTRAANEPKTSSNGVELGADGKLWPSLISAGSAMLASRSPFFGNAVGEGGQAGMATYSAEVKAQQEAQQHADQLQLERERLERPYKEMTASEKAADARSKQTEQGAQINQPVIIGPNGKPMVNPAYVAAKQATEKDYQPKFIPGATNPLTGEQLPDRIYDPNTKTVTTVTPDGQPIAKPIPAPDIDTVKTVDQTGMVGLNKAQTAAPYNYAVRAPVIEKGMDVPEPDLQYIPRASAASLKADAATYLQTGKLPSAPVSRGTPLAVAAVNYRAAVQNYGNAVAQSRGFTPDQLASMWRMAPDLPKFVMGQPGQATVSLGVAMSHLDTLKQFIDAAQFPDTPRFKQIQAQLSREFGSSAATNVDAAASVVGPEIVKAIGIAGAGTADERDHAANMFKGGAKQSTDAIGVVQHLMAGQLEGKQRQAQAVGMPEEVFKGLIGNKAYDLLKNLDKEVGNSVSTPAAPTGAVGTRKDTQGKTWYVDKDGKALGPAQ